MLAPPVGPGVAVAHLTHGGQVRERVRPSCRPVVGVPFPAQHRVASDARCVMRTPAHRALAGSSGPLVEHHPRLLRNSHFRTLMPPALSQVMDGAGVADQSEPASIPKQLRFAKSSYMPPMPPMPPMSPMPPPPGIWPPASGFSTTTASVVSSSPAIEAAFWSAMRTTLVGSITPAWTRFS